MLPFATEFPVKAFDNRAAFVAEVIAWLQGASYSSVLSSASEQDLDNENAHLRAASGEELRLRELRTADRWSAVGFRHDFPDNEGRLWRTEGVLRRAVAERDQDLIRLRTQCLARAPGAHLESPRKPYLIKLLLMNGWGGTDRTLVVSDQPVFLNDDEEGITTAWAATLGEATSWLPTVYVSATHDGTWLLTSFEIERLAFDLGGIAHVVVEPSRAFSFRLRDESEGRNVYGGTVGLSVPGQGIVRRYYLGLQIQDGRELAAAIRIAVRNLRGQMPTVGWDWTDLQEQALRGQRERDKNRLSIADSERLYQDEIDNLQDKIRVLEQELASRSEEDVRIEEREFSTDNLARGIGPEIYTGEVSDRLRFAAQTTLAAADRIGLDARSIAVLQQIVKRVPISPALHELLQDIDRATKDPKRIAGELTSLLARHGYREKSDNRHVRLEPAAGFAGLESITLSKTPSDNRALQNTRKQVERTLGINKLMD